MEVLIPKNTCIPTKKQITRTIHTENPQNILFKVYEGDRQMVCDNRLIGKINLKDVPPTESGVYEIEITFDIDPNFNLVVEAWHKASGKTEKLTY